MKIPAVWFGVVALGSLLGTACSHSGSSSVYRGPVGTAVNVPVSEQRGRIISVRDVLIKDALPTYSTGTTGGAVATAARVLSGSITAIAGVVGDTIDGAKPGTAGEEITIITDEGKTIVLVQALGNPPFAPDERVIIQKGVGAAGGSGGSTRVVRELQFAGEDAGRYADAASRRRR